VGRGEEADKIKDETIKERRKMCHKEQFTLWRPPTIPPISLKQRYWEKICKGGRKNRDLQVAHQKAGKELKEGGTRGVLPKQLYSNGNRRGLKGDTKGRAEKRRPRGNVEKKFGWDHVAKKSHKLIRGKNVPGRLGGVGRKVKKEKVFTHQVRTEGQKGRISIRGPNKF